MLKKIQEYIKDKRYTQALECIKALDTKESNQLTYLKLYAHIAFICDKKDIALQKYETLFKDYIGSLNELRPYLEYANILLESRENTKAKTVLLLGIQKFPKNTTLLKRAIGVLKKEHDYGLALELARDLIKTSSREILHYKILIDILFRSKKYEIMKLELQNSKNIFTEDSFMLEEINYCLGIEDYRLGLSIYKKLSLINPEESSNYIGQYNMLIKLDRLDEAKKALKEGVEKSQNRDKLYTILANINIKLLDYKDAVKYLRLLINMDPLCIDHYNKLCFVYQKMNCFKASLEMAQKALCIDPDNNEGLLNLGITYMKLREFKSARNIFCQIIKNDKSHQKATTYLLALDIEEKKYKQEEKRYREGLSLSFKNNVDFYLYIDRESEFTNAHEMIKICKKRLCLKNNDSRLMSRVIVFLLEDAKEDEAIKYWEELLKQEDNDLELLYLYEKTEKYTIFSDEIDQLHVKTLSVLRNIFKNPKGVDSIAILGGSNSIMLDGWAPSFKSLAAQCLNINVDNYGLGGISSLYGLFLAKEKNLFEKYDVVIFEYTLNDIYFDYSKCYSYTLLRSVLYELICEAKKHQSVIVFITMSPLDNIEKLESGTCAITKIYHDIALRSENGCLFDIYNIIKNSGYSSIDFEQLLYRDNTHYASSFAKSISHILLTKLAQGSLCVEKKIDITVQKEHGYDLTHLKLLDSIEYTVTRSYEFVKRESSIISRNFLCIKKDSKIRVFIAKGTRVLALLINSSEHSGYIKVKFSGRIFIKNIFAERPINDTDKARIYLKQFTKELIDHEKDTYIELSVDISQEDMDNLDVDTTAYQETPKVSLDQFELEIAGILVA